MGASFRNVGEITELAGSDLLTIAPSLLAELQATEVELPRKLDPENASKLSIEKISIDKATFEANLSPAKKVANAPTKSKINIKDTFIV